MRDITASEQIRHDLNESAQMLIGAEFLLSRTEPELEQVWDSIKRAIELARKCEDEVINMVCDKQIKQIDEQEPYNWAKEHGDYDHSRDDERIERQRSEY